MANPDVNPHLSTTTSLPNDHDADLCAVTQLVGCAVMTSAREGFGRVHDLAQKRTSAHVAYVVVAFGGALGIGSKYVALPWHLLDIHLAVGQPPRIHLRITSGSVHQSGKRWGTLINQSHRRRTGHHAVQGDTAGRSSAGDRHRISDYLGAVVWNAQHHRVARIADVLVDARRGTVEHFVLRHGGMFGLCQRYVTVPMHELVFVGTNLVCKDAAAWLAPVPPGPAAAAAAISVTTTVAAAEPSPVDAIHGFGGVEVRVCGSIVTMGSASTASGVEPHLRLRLRTDGGGEVVVQAGVNPGIDGTQLLRDGQYVEVHGWYASQGGQTMLVATSILLGSQSIGIDECPRDEISIPQ